MIFRALLGTSAVVGGLCIISDTFYRKLDRNLLRPVRDYRMFLSDYNRIQT
jgi:hypothetical protein